MFAVARTTLCRSAWRDMPAVEFVAPEKPPDNWYLPSMKRKLRLAVEAREPLHINLVVNLTPSERLTGSSRVQNRNLGALLPATKILSQVEWRNATFSVALLDVSRRRITYAQEDTQGLEWSKASNSLAGSILELLTSSHSKTGLTARSFLWMK